MSRGGKRNEGNVTPARLSAILNVGGMVAFIPHQGTLDEIAPAPHAPQGSSRTDVQHACGNSTETTVQAYLYAIERTGRGPVGIGTDLNGFAGWPGPRFGAEQCSGGTTTAPGGYIPLARLTYPFTIRATGASFRLDRSIVGSKTFDFNNDGLAQIGLLPDMIADFQAMGVTANDLDPLFLSAEGYIRLWERASYLAGR
jgi:microsomal dipeptidase-like Zn-dependent dipeptidase